jgi:hypothetical protein
MNDSGTPSLAAQKEVVDVFPDVKEWKDLSRYLDCLTQRDNGTNVFRITVPELPGVGTQSHGRSPEISGSAIYHDIIVDRNIFQLTPRSAQIAIPVPLIQIETPESRDSDDWVAQFEQEVYSGTRTAAGYITNLDVSKEIERRRCYLRKSAISPLKCSALDNISRQVPGIHECQAFISQGFGTVFQLHIKDYGLKSLDHNVCGAPTVWTTNPRKERTKLEHAVRRDLGLSERESQFCEQFIRHRNIYVSRRFLLKHGIEHSEFIQHPGQIIYLEDGVYHQGFNCGFKIAEARNYDGKGWDPESLGVPCWKTQNSSCGIPKDQASILTGNTLRSGVQKKRKSKHLGPSPKRRKIQRFTVEQEAFES